MRTNILIDLSPQLPTDSEENEVVPGSPETLDRKLLKQSDFQSPLACIKDGAVKSKNAEYDKKDNESIYCLGPVKDPDGFILKSRNEFSSFLKCRIVHSVYIPSSDCKEHFQHEIFNVVEILDSGFKFGSQYSSTSSQHSGSLADVSSLTSKSSGSGGCLSQTVSTINSQSLMVLSESPDDISPLIMDKVIIKKSSTIPLENAKTEENFVSNNKKYETPKSVAKHKKTFKKSVRKNTRCRKQQIHKLFSFKEAGVQTEFSESMQSIEINKVDGSEMHKNISSSFSSEEKDVALSSLPNSISLKPGVHVFAKWADKRYYSGKLNKKVKNEWEIIFDDGHSRVMSNKEFLVLDELPLGISVFALTPDNTYESGIICKVHKDKSYITYEVDMDNFQQCNLFSASRLMLNADQVRFLEEALQGKICSFIQSSPSKSRRRRKNLTCQYIIDDEVAGPSHAVTPSKISLPSGMIGCNDKELKVSRKRGRPKKILQPTYIESTSDDTSDRMSKKILQNSLKKNKIDKDHDMIFCFILTCVKDPLLSILSEQQKSHEAKIKLSSHFQNDSDDQLVMNWLDCLQIPTESDSDDNDLQSLCSNLFGGDLIPLDKELVENTIIHYGGIIFDTIEELLENNSENRYLLSNACCKSYKYIRAVSAGIPVLHVSWLFTCIEKKQLLNKSLYELPYGYSILNKAEINVRPCLHPLLNCSLLLISNISGFFDIYYPILTDAGAKVFGAKDDLSKVKYIVTNEFCPGDVTILAKIQNVPIVSIVWALQCILSGQQLNIYSHPRFFWKSIE